MNDRWIDVEEYLERGQFDDAGTTIGMIILELLDEVTQAQIDDLLNAIGGELE